MNRVASETEVTPRDGIISLRQCMIFFLFFSICISTRVTIKLAGDKSFNGGFIAAAAVIVPEFLLLMLLFSITKKFPGKTLPEIVQIVLGKVVGKAFLILYYVFLMLYISFLVRNFYEKFIISIFTDTAGAFFAIVIIFLAVFAVRRNVEIFARFAEIIFIIVTVFFTAAFFISLFSVDLKNIYPVTTKDIPGILQTTLHKFSSWSLVTFIFFLGSMKKNDNGNNAPAYKFILIAALINFIGSILTAGIFNAATAQNLSMPFYMVFKTIKTVGVIQSFETFFIMLWVLTDIIAVVFLFFAMKNTSKTLLSLSTDQYFIYPAAFAIFILAFIIGKNQAEVEFFYRYILNSASLLLCIFAPILIFITAKIRRLL